MIVKCREEYRAQVKKICEDMDLVCRECLSFDGEKLYFDDEEDDMFNKEEDVYIVDTICSL